MDGEDWLDSQFDRAVEIVQGLSKTGPIQTGYEEKLAMYSLYKQATVGNVPSTRPGIWDVLGRAKWDAWARHRDMDEREAKRQYVDTLLRVLRKYSGRTVARDLAKELDSYRPETSVEDEDYEPRSSSSASPSVMSPPPPPPEQFYDPSDPNAELLQSASTEQWGQVSRSAITQAMEDDAFNAASEVTSQGARPMSSVSRYRTPMTQSIQLPMSERTTSPPPPMPLIQQFSAPVLPSSQPIPRHATPSAYAVVTSGSSQPVSSRTSVGYGPSATAPPVATAFPAYPHPYGHIRTQQGYPDTSSASGVPFPVAPGAPSIGRAPRPPLERALESMQASLAALHERLESIESAAIGEREGSPILSGVRSRQNSGVGGRPRRPRWAESWGMWGIVLSPFSYALSLLQRSVSFILSNETFRRSPVLAIVRRLFLDLSFLLTLAALARYAWRRSGLTKRDVKRLVLHAWAIATSRNRQPRALAHAGVQA
ncbi:ACBP-domain-containing protein [Calocera cornea HHB12733]|uniref:ACBP-domain-containing protein n=1 Tax=Calocera cornea HHB12733 TaxID=1353952 RepID=A0A165JQP3_9BASI|nr:ACBP-domain-containing protein [Calocera cornea HHB12733]